MRSPPPFMLRGLSPMSASDSTAPSNFGVPVDAYLATEFLAYDGDRIASIHIGGTSPEIDALLRAHDATHGVFITGWNPASQAHDDATNAAANQRMATEFATLGVTTLHHVGRSPDAAWSEDGFFALGLPVETAITIAERFGQFAIVVARLGVPAELVITRIGLDR